MVDLDEVSFRRLERIYAELLQRQQEIRNGDPSAQEIAISHSLDSRLERVSEEINDREMSREYGRRTIWETDLPGGVDLDDWR